MPYSCIFPDCSISSKLFDSRHEWYGHLQKEHRVYNPERGGIAGSTSGIGMRDPNTSGPSNCVLCEEPLKSSREFERHVARHLQELALYVLPREEADDEDEILDDPPHDDYLPGAATVASANPDDHLVGSGTLEMADSPTPEYLTPPPRSISRTISVEQASSAGDAQLVEPDIQTQATEFIPSGVANESSQRQSSGEILSGWKTRIKMVLHLHDTSIISAKLDTAAQLDVMSKRVAVALGTELESYSGEDVRELGGRMKPLGQLTMDWHVMSKKKTYTTTFLVVDTEEFDVLLGEKTMDEIGFYKVDKDVW